MTQPHRHPHDESRRPPLRLAPLPRPTKSDAHDEPIQSAPLQESAAWILEWSLPAPGDGTDA